MTSDTVLTHIVLILLFPLLLFSVLLEPWFTVSEAEDWYTRKDQVTETVRIQGIYIKKNRYIGHMPLHMTG